MSKPNVLLVMTDQQRFDTIASLGNPYIHTPNLDRLAARGMSFTNAYTPVPECLPARYSISSGCQPTRTGVWSNISPRTVHESIERDCGPYLPATMASLGYRTFGVGKIHARRWDAPLGFDVDLRSEELYVTPEQRSDDAYASWIAREHPQFAFIEQLMGERTEMYYVPQMSPLPAHLGQEAWAADRAVEQICRTDDDRPWFGFVSFIGPHPPLAPPIPFNRMYDPDRMPTPVRGDIAVDHLDDFIPWMNYAVFAEDINDSLARVVKARYYGEITYIDACIGRILDAIDDDTLVCFYSDHGDHLGDHHGWQKESFFEASVRVPFLLSWPDRIEPAGTTDMLVSLTDLFAIATGATGKIEPRDGIDVLAALDGTAPARTTLLSYYGNPGTRYFKAMVREDQWKYVWLANGRRELLFDLSDDPSELTPRDDPATCRRLRARIDVPLEGFDFEPFRRQRIYQFDYSRGITAFPRHPGDILETQ